MELAIQGGILLILLALGFFVGTASERRHLRSLQQREAESRDFFISQIKSFPGAVETDLPPMLIIGEVVIATDYLKSFLSKLRNIFGGEVRSYQSLLIRARREALLRIVRQAQQQGYNAICNLRYDTADVGGNSVARRVATVAILASATAYQRAASS